MNKLKEHWEEARALLKGTPQLPSPTDLPRFPEEGERDPFGQNAEMLKAAGERAFHLTVRLASSAHSRGLCMMLPRTEPGFIDPSLHPWRSIVPCDADVRGSSSDIPLPAVHWGPSDATGIQNLVQRAALCVAAMDEQAPPDAHDNLAELLEELGYITLGLAFQEKKLEHGPPRTWPLRAFHAIGQTAAKMHRHNMLHGDMHPGNFRYDPTKGTPRGSPTPRCDFRNAP